jgi:hypothetical protein
MLLDCKMNKLGACLIALLLISAYPFTVKDAAQATTASTLIDSDTTWSKADSPYELQGPVAINQGISLTIEPGVVVNMVGNYLQVNGTLIAKGTATDHIFFNNGFIAFTNLSSGWNEATSSGSIIEYANFTAEFGNQRYRYSTQITVQGASPKLNAVFNVASADIADGGGSQMIANCYIWHLIAHGSQTIFNNTIDNLEVFGTQQVMSNTVGVFTVDGSQVVSSNSVRGMQISGSPIISGNNVQTSVAVLGGSPIVSSNIIADGMDAKCDSAIIWNNTITHAPHGDDDFVINLRATGQPIVSNNNITGLMTPMHHGITLYGTENAEIYGPYYTAYGIQATGNVQISNNNISGCVKAGILIQNGKATIQSNIINGKGVILNSANTKIQHNNLQEGGIYLWANALGTIDATDNWWGTTDPAAIDQTIYDSNDDFNLGTVNYQSILDAPNQQAGLDPNAALPTPVPTLTPQPTQSAASAHTNTPIFQFPNLLADPTKIALVTIIIVLVAVIVALVIKRRN